MLNKKSNFHFFDSLSICFRVAPRITTGIIMFNIISSLIPSVLVVLNTNFINFAIEYNKNRGSVLWLCLTAFVLSFFLSYSYFQSILSKLLYERLGMTLREKLDEEVIEKCLRLKYEYLENAQKCDLIKRVIDIQPLIQNCFSNMLSIVAVVFQLFSISILIINASWWIFPVLLICIIPLIVITYYSGKEEYKTYRWNSELSRKSDYLEFEVLRSRDRADERTLFGYTNYFNDKFEKFFHIAVDRENKIRKKWMVANNLASMLIVGVCCVIIFYMMTELKKDAITIGFFTSISGALIQLSGVLSKDLSGVLNKMVLDFEFSRDLNEFINLEETTIVENKDVLDDIESIEFRDVYFKYPGTDNFVLNGVSFLIKKGTHFAIVGKNGSGKSTITKLILKLYEVNAGEILINGINIKEISSRDLYRLFSVIYQDFAKYSIAVGDNIAIGAGSPDVKFGAIKQAANLADIEQTIENLPYQYETYLGKVFSEGVDLSGGEWQKLALARSLMKRNSVKILDEPTASLDPIQESQLYKQYSKIANNNTTIFISHRLGSTKLADVILLIDEGKVLGCNSHEILMDTCALYREMFSIQKEWYIND